MNLKGIRAVDNGQFYGGEALGFVERAFARRYRDDDEAIRAARVFYNGSVEVVDMDDGDRVVADAKRIFRDVREMSAADYIARYYEERG